MRVFTPLPLAPWRDAAPAASAAEAAGFDAAMSVELGHDVFAPLAFAALATSRIELTPSIAVAFPRSPTVLAHQAWDLAANSAGRFVLGLGSQVKGHNERRYGIPWTAPAPRLADYIGALRAIWRAWESRGKLDYHSDHYTLTLMTPDFSPEPTGLPTIPITVAAVGEAMLRMAGRCADGVRLHPLCSRRYLEQVCLPALAAGMARAGRKREIFDIHGGGFAVTGPDEASLVPGLEKARARIGFYASTRSYRPILALHGREDLCDRLHALSVAGRWAEMAAAIDDDTLRLFAVGATFRDLPGAIAARYGGAADSFDLTLPRDTPPGLARELIADIHRIPRGFTGFDTNWPAR
ncbi:MAG: TIGR03617 family F420-dependent LLM class oxidoreductase [Rhodospirillales bacterium]|nr:TIGR03617 family F420-dependent LLM class oxidoreductase [Rhodospirillales bacterium]